MKRIILILSLIVISAVPVYAWEMPSFFNLRITNNDARDVKKVLESQVKYANKTDFDKFISTYDQKYINGDGFNLDTYSSLVKETWKTYDKIEYGIEIKNVAVCDDKAIAELTETSYAEVPVNENITGELKSIANSVYYLQKTNDGWKVVSDSILDETTSMLYGEAKDLDIKLTVPKQILADTEYTASLEFTPPAETIAIASITSEKVEYPQKQMQEVFRKMPEDNILERIFRANTDNVNEYIIASIGLTKADVSDMSIKLSLTGFGYTIKRVNVIPQNKFITVKEEPDNAENK